MKSKVEKINALAKTKYLSLYEAQYKNKLGDDRTWMIASRKSEEEVKLRFFGDFEERIDAVVIVAFHEEEKKVVLVKQFRVPINDFVYELPAGLVDGEEEVESCVRRELKEETGLELIKIDYENSKMNAYISSGMTDECVAFIRCTCRGEISSEFLEGDEELEAVLVGKEDGKRILNSNEKIDIRAVLVLQDYIKG